MSICIKDVYKRQGSARAAVIAMDLWKDLPFFGIDVYKRQVDFKTSHVRTFFSALSDEGLAHSTIKGLYGLLNPSFELSVEDGIIRKNPVTGTLGDYGAPAKEKEAIKTFDRAVCQSFI